MAYHTWQVGLDIQNGQLCALAIQRRRQGWQLRHWWQQPLPETTLHNGVLQCDAELTAQLRQWRHRLPRHFSLRVGFPPQPVLQHHLPTPPMRLSSADRNHYVAANASRLFPIDLRALVVDYREIPQPGGGICLTAARRETVDSWLAVLSAAELNPQVMELSPNALASLGRALSLPADATLVHRLADHWIWYHPLKPQACWGWCSRADVDDFTTLQATYFADAVSIWFSAAQSTRLPEGTRALQPLQAVTLHQPPLPVHQQSFVLAAGLALRLEDS